MDNCEFYVKDTRGCFLSAVGYGFKTITNCKCRHNPDCHYKQLENYKEQYNADSKELQDLQLIEALTDKNILLQNKIESAVWALKDMNKKACIGCELYVDEICTGAKIYEAKSKKHWDICMEHRNNKLIRVLATTKVVLDKLKGE